MEKIVAFHKKLATILGMLILVLMFIIVVDACGRFMFNKPLPGAVELSRVVLAWILYLSLPWGLIQGVHVRVMLFLDRYPPRLRQTVEIMIVFLSMVVFSLMIYAGSRMFWNSFKFGETMAAPIWIPFWLAKLAVPVGCLMMALHFPIDLIARLKLMARDKTAE
jgi:TRAP-type C4-dicarboxylate transport system permease small subunit